MPRFAEKQDNGLYCVYSTIVDDITAFDMTRNELATYWIEKEVQATLDRVDERLKELDNPERIPYPMEPDKEEIDKCLKKAREERDES